MAVCQALYHVRQAQHHAKILGHIYHKVVVFEYGEQQNADAHRDKNCAKFLFIFFAGQQQAAKVGGGRYGHKHGNAPPARLSIKKIVADAQSHKVGCTTATRVPTQHHYGQKKQDKLSGNKVHERSDPFRTCSGVVAGLFVQNLEAVPEGAAEAGRVLAAHATGCATLVSVITSVFIQKMQLLLHGVS